MSHLDMSPRHTRWRIRPIKPIKSPFTPYFFIMHGDVRITKIGPKGYGIFTSIAESMDAICHYLKGKKS